MAVLLKVLRAAQGLQKKKGDSHLSVDVLAMALTDDSSVAEALKEAGMGASKVKSELEKIRGEGKVQSASGDSNFQVRPRDAPSMHGETLQRTDKEHGLRFRASRGSPVRVRPPQGGGREHGDACGDVMKQPRHKGGTQKGI